MNPAIFYPPFFTICGSSGRSGRGGRRLVRAFQEPQVAIVVEDRLPPDPASRDVGADWSVTRRKLPAEAGRPAVGAFSGRVAEFRLHDP
jgi:hypothetical protein